MPAFLVPRPDYVPSFGEKLGSSLGEGLGTGIQKYADAKLQRLNEEYQRDKRRTEVGPLLKKLGLPEEYADAPDSMLNILVQQHLKQQQQQQMGQQAHQTLQSLLGGNAGSNPQQSDQQGLQSVLGNLGQSSSSEGQPMAAPQGSSALQSQGYVRPGTELPIANFIEQRKQHEVTNKRAEEANRIASGRLEETKRANIKQEETKQNEINSTKHKDLLENIKTKGREAIQSIRNSESLINLTKTNKLNSGPWRNALNKFPGLADIFNNPETDAAKTLMAERTGNIIRAVGARNISETEARVFSNMGPAIFQTNAGIIFNAKNDIISAKEALQEDKLRKEILSASKGNVPSNFDEILETKMEPYRKRYSIEFKKNLNDLINSAPKKPDINKLPVKTLLTHPITGEKEIIELDSSGKKVLLPYKGA